MPVTKTAKRALRGSTKKAAVNASMKARLEIAVRVAEKGKKEKDVIQAISLADRSAKSHIIHKNKAARLKSQLSKIFPKKSGSTKTTKTSKKTKK